MKKAIRPDDLPKALMHYSPCISAGNSVFTSGALATDYRQARVVFRAIKKLVTAGDSSLENIIKQVAGPHLVRGSTILLDLIAAAPG